MKLLSRLLSDWLVRPTFATTPTERAARVPARVPVSLIHDPLQFTRTQNTILAPSVPHSDSTKHRPVSGATTYYTASKNA